MIDAAEPGLYLATSALVLIGLNWCRKYWDNHLHPPLPPGPPSLPILGSIFSLDDAARPWLGFNAWRSIYGDLIYARLLSKPVVVVSSEEIAKDLFEGRPNIYSDKPQSLVYEPFALDFHASIFPYGDRWRLHRRIFNQPFRPVAIPAYHAKLRRGAHNMLFSFLQDPTNYTSHIQTFPPSFILPIVYGYEPKGKDDHLTHVIRRYLELASANFGSTAVAIMETFPFLLQLPVWFPGATFKRASIECLKAGHDMKEIPFNYVKEVISNGQMLSCVVTDTMNRMNGFENHVIETAIKEAASTMFAGADETTTSTLLVFLLAMILHPEVQAKAQAEIERVIGRNRLPDFDDRPALPYVDAILRETLRWYPAFPLGIPHATTTSDVYNGYFIPKGVTVIANTWAMTHDEEKYPSPDEFKPERFIHEDGSLTSDTMPLGFGFGRRACVGRHLAQSALWIAMASVLATFSIHKAFDEHGEEIPVIPKFSAGITSSPETFPCRIVPRLEHLSVEKLTQMTGLVAEEL